MPKQRCNAFRADDERCRSYPAGTWHVCRYHEGEPLPIPRPCRCAAYKKPHRYGSNVCRWLEEPTRPFPTPLGTHKHHARYREQAVEWERLCAAAERDDKVAAREAVACFAALRRELETITAKL